MSRDLPLLILLVSSDRRQALVKTNIGYYYYCCNLALTAFSIAATYANSERTYMSMQKCYAAYMRAHNTVGSLCEKEKLLSKAK